MDRPLVSVLIRVRDEVDLLRRTLDALGRQKIDAPAEIVVLDNESVDGSAQVALDSGARVFTFPRPLFGYGRALNLGIELSRGDIVVLLSAHSVPLESSWLVDLIQPIRAHPSTGAVFCRQVPPCPLPRMERHRFACFPHRDVILEQQDFLEACAHGRDPYEAALFSNSACAIRREVALRHPFRDLSYSEDRAFVVDYVTAGGAVAYLADVTVAYDRRWSWKRTYHAHYRCEVSRHLIREMALSATGNRFDERRDDLKKLARALFVIPLACGWLARALTERKRLRSRALRHVPNQMAAVLAVARAVMRWPRHRWELGCDQELMRQVRDECTELTCASSSEQEPAR